MTETEWDQFRESVERVEVWLKAWPASTAQLTFYIDSKTRELVARRRVGASKPVELRLPRAIAQIANIINGQKLRDEPPKTRACKE